MPDVMWERFSIWLITAGLVMAGLAILAFVIDLVGGKPSAPAWPAAAGYAAAVVLAWSTPSFTAAMPIPPWSRPAWRFPRWSPSFCC